MPVLDVGVVLSLELTSGIALCLALDVNRGSITFSIRENTRFSLSVGTRVSTMCRH